MSSISLPSKVEITSTGKHRARVVVEPCYPGYGTTLGNALRRVLLSSLPGAAVTAAKMTGVDHEFSTIPYVKEDAVSILLNLKLLRFKLHGDEPVTMRLTATGERAVTGADLEGPSSIEVMNPKQLIATLTDKAANVELEIIVGSGRGYVPVENREKEKLDIGWISVDAVYTPVRTVNFTIDNVRVGQMTNYDRLNLDIETDGTIKPETAVQDSANILVEHFQQLATTGVNPEPTPKRKRSSTKKATPDEATIPAKAESAPSDTPVDGAPDATS